MRRKDVLAASMAALAVAFALTRVSITSTWAQNAPDKPAPPAVLTETGSIGPGAAGGAAASPGASPASMAQDPPPAAVDPLIEQIRQQLAQPARGTIDRSDYAALARFYAERNGPPLWVGAAGLTARAQHAIAEISRADDWGLSASAFELPRLATAENVPAVLAAAEIRLGLAVLKYARYARGGRLDPAQLSRNFDQKPPLRDPKEVLSAIANSETPGTYLQSLHPKHPQFERLRQAFLKARGGANRQDEPQTRVQLPDGPTLKLGMQHPDVALLRTRLKLSAPQTAESVYDEEIHNAVKAFQQKSGIKPTGSLTPRTRAALNSGAAPKAPFGSEAQRLIVNMERWRWMPEDLGEFYVWDNIPEFQTRVVRNGKVIHQAKIIVGKPETQTAIFSANMRFVVFHPEWGVPDSIKVKELLPYLQPAGGGFFGMFGGTDTRILQRHNLRVTYNGRPVDASQVDWGQVDIRRFTFIQPAGATNVLGVVKFRFPNRHDIYMHDTPQRELFERPVRLFSHGCIRVQDPGRLAEILLEADKGWSAAQVRALLAQGYNNEITLNTQIPVHVTYFTAVAGEDGTVAYHPDVYGHDSRVLAALSGRPLPLEPAAGEETARNFRPGKYKQTSNDFFGGLFGN